MYTNNIQVFYLGGKDKVFLITPVDKTCRPYSCVFEYVCGGEASDLLIWKVFNYVKITKKTEHLLAPIK